MKYVDKRLQEYIEQNILPRYNSFDRAHRCDHAEAVIARSMALAEHYDVEPDMVYTVAAYHDTGLIEGRENHHTASADIIRHDKQLQEWFSETQIEIMAEAAADHRASLDSAPRTIYGKIVAEADRLIEPQMVIRRTVQYGLSNYPHLDREAQYKRFCEHLTEKYDYGGYLRLWLPESDNAPRLEQLRKIIGSKERLREIFEQEYEQLSNTK